MPRLRTGMLSFTRVAAVALAAGAFALAGGCAGSGGGGGDEPDLSSASSALASQKLDLDAYARVGFRVKWTSYASMSPGDEVTDFAVLGDLVAVQDSSTVVTAITGSSGEIRWISPLAGPLSKFMGMVRDGKRIIACSESEAFFIDADAGTLITKQRFERVVSTKPVLMGPQLVFGTSVGEVLAHLNNGFKAWAYGIGGSIDAAPVAIGSDYVGVVSQNGQVIILTGAGAAAARSTVYGGMACELAASDRTLFVASLDQSIYAFDTFQNRPKWRKRTDAPLRRTPTYHAGRLYCETASAGLLCLNAEDGREIWASKSVSGTVVGLAKGRLLCWNGAEMTLLDPANGDVIERAALPGLKKLVIAPFDNGKLYAVTPEGAVHQFEPR